MSVDLEAYGRGPAIRQCDSDSALLPATSCGLRAPQWKRASPRAMMPTNAPGTVDVIITPHYAGRSDGRAVRQEALALENIERFMAGLPLKNVVDQARGF